MSKQWEFRFLQLSFSYLLWVRTFDGVNSSVQERSAHLIFQIVHVTILYQLKALNSEIFVSDGFTQQISSLRCRLWLGFYQIKDVHVYLVDEDKSLIILRAHGSMNRTEEVFLVWHVW